MVRFNSYKAVGAVLDGCQGGEYDDVIFLVFWRHGISDDFACKGIGVGDVGAVDVLVGESWGVSFVCKFGGVARGDVIDERYLLWGCCGLYGLYILGVVEYLVDVFFELTGFVELIEGFNFCFFVFCGVVDPSGELLSFGCDVGDFVKFFFNLLGCFFPGGLVGEFALWKLEGFF